MQYAQMNLHDSVGYVSTAKTHKNSNTILLIYVSRAGSGTLPLLYLFGRLSILKLLQLEEFLHNVNRLLRWYFCVH